MKIVVIGGTGLIGSRLVNLLRQGGHEVIPASPSLGINTLTGEGLDAALAGAQVVVDVANSPSFEDKAVMEFFETSGRILLAAEKKAHVAHHVALSVVGTDRLQQSGYFRAKLAQENLIKASGVPYSIVRATQFFEFLGAIAQSGTQGGTVRLPAASLQPISADDVAALMRDVATGRPLNAMIDIAGPEKLPMNEMIGRYLAAGKDARTAVTDAGASYFGAMLEDSTLVPTGQARLGPTRLEAWYATTQAGAGPAR